MARIIRLCFAPDALCRQIGVHFGACFFIIPFRIRNLRSNLFKRFTGQSTITVGNINTIQWNRPLSIRLRSVAKCFVVPIGSGLAMRRLPFPLRRNFPDERMELQCRNYRNRKRRLRSTLDLIAFSGSPLSYHVSFLLSTGN